MGNSGSSAVPVINGRAIEPISTTTKQSTFKARGPMTNDIFMPRRGPEELPGLLNMTIALAAAHLTPAVVGHSPSLIMPEWLPRWTLLADVGADICHDQVAGGSSLLDAIGRLIGQEHTSS